MDEKVQTIGHTQCVLPTRSQQFILQDVQAFHRENESLRAKDDVKTCARDESCQSDRLHEISKSNNGRAMVWCATEELGELWSVEYELMEECYIQLVWLSRRALIRVTGSSKYSLTPMNVNLVRAGRTEHVGGGCRPSRGGRNRGDSNPMDVV